MSSPGTPSSITSSDISGTPQSNNLLRRQSFRMGILNMVVTPAKAAQLGKLIRERETLSEMSKGKIWL